MTDTQLSYASGASEQPLLGMTIDRNLIRHVRNIPHRMPLSRFTKIVASVMQN